ncbi:TolC family protein [uncultured Mucilaginibacter sp.]|uniref:TolC family protein n=1 Tax=uncultured Mucilaginibacter sp. TaxID=797541 RepID=UPI0026276EAC|nr:TolC family protein [uncultured Mucilaginibacter sp.]
MNLLFSHINSYAQLKITLQQAIDSTLNRNLQIKQAQFNAAFTEENLKQAKYNLLPSISASPQSSFNWGRTLDVSTYNYINQRVFLVNGSFNTQVALFQGGQLRRQIVQNKLLLEADQSNIAKIKNDLILSVATTFLQVMASEDLLKAARQQVQVAKLGVERTQKSYNAGNKSLADLAQAQAQQATTELDETNIQNTLEANLLTLKQLMEMQTITLDLIKPDISKLTNESRKLDTAALWKEVLAVNPDIKLANLQKNAAYQNIRVAKSSLYPSLYLFGSIGSNFSDARSLITGTKQVGFDTVGFVNGTNQRVLEPAYRSTVNSYPFLRQFSDNFYQSAGITLQIPLLNHFNSQTNIRKAKITYQNAQVAVQLTVNNLYKIFNQALADLNAANKRLAANQSNYQATKQVLYVSEKRYQAGLLNSVDYNIALTNFNKVEFDLIQAKYDLVFRNKVIDYYLGKPLILN